MEGYVLIGERKIINNKYSQTFAQDKDNSIFIVRKSVKLLPMQIKIYILFQWDKRKNR